MRTASITAARNNISIVIVFIASGAVVFAWFLDPVAFVSGGWKGSVAIYVGTFYAFFRIRGPHTWLGPVILTAKTSSGVMLFADLTAGATFLVGIYLLFNPR